MTTFNKPTVRYIVLLADIGNSSAMYRVSFWYEVTTQLDTYFLLDGVQIRQWKGRPPMKVDVGL